MAGSRRGQSDRRDAGFASRFSAALAGRTQKWLADRTGLSTSTIGAYSQGSIPSPDRLFLLADTLGVPPRWFATGEGEPVLTPVEDADWVQLPRYDLARFTPEGKPESNATLPLRRDWLFRAVGHTSGLWLADMPSDALPDLAQEGDTLICADFEPPFTEGRVHIFSLDGRIVIRKVYFRPEGLLLKASNPEFEPIEVKAADAQHLPVLGRVLAVISVHPI